MAVYKSVCYETDSVLVEIIHLIEKEIKYKLLIEKLMNQGFVNIAKARYIMGSTCVTKMQLPTVDSNPIKPVAVVCRAELNNHWVYHVHRKKIPSATSGINPQTLEKFEDNVDEESTENINENLVSSSETAFQNVLQNHPKALRNAKIGFNVNDDIYQECNEELLDEFSTDSGSIESLYSIVDPIRLFGILVPNTLKQAQKTFIEVINLVAKCATLQANLQASLLKYNHLQKVKHLIEIAASESNLEILKPKVYWTQSEISSVICHSDTQEVQEEESEKEKINVTKSVRSVFFDQEQLLTQENEQSIWGSDNNSEKTYK